jgi:hypothetical protein
MKEIATQVGRTVRYSLAGWGRTVRLCVILVVVVYVYVLVARL